MDEWKEVFEVISVIHPSRGRGEQAYKTAVNWIEKSDTNIEYTMVIDSDDLDSYNPGMDDFIMWANRSGAQNLSIMHAPNKSAIEAINYGALNSFGNVFVVISDDFDCPPHWDTLLLNAIGDKTDFCAKTNDGHQDWLITLPIMDRMYYERFGYVYHPSYKHIYADAEMTTVAWMLDKYIKLDIEFKHNHYSLIGQQPDAVNLKNNESWSSGKLNFMKRWENGFDLNMHFEKFWPFEQLKKQGLTHYINEYWDNQFKSRS